MQDFEKLGAFYLGKLYDLHRQRLRDDLLLYESKDLTTHAVCVGMTGSGKTGLCLSLLEEAAIDGVPAIAIDPKGDLGNLFLTFPQLRPADFRLWIDEGAAARQGMTPDAFAAKTAKTWREGLERWGQSPRRIARFRDAVDMAIYTPGSSAGLPLTVLRSFNAPSPAVRDDPDALRERISSAASGLLALLGVDADPVRSREHILISNVLSHAWRAGKNLDIVGLIRGVQSPPFDRVGVMDLESFLPQRERDDLAMSLNSLLASPSFASWMEGEPLDVGRLLYTAEGKPRLSIVSIAHLSEAERMFFVTILLNEVVAWVRSQSGTSSLRALLYMDEVFGYFPPTANPPSKTPMLTLLKQARAFGLGVVLATQNPVDLDYKGLSNAGTWFLGRLQTERDKARVMEGLEGVAAQTGASLDRAAMDAALSGLRSRVFLMNNVHEDAPVVFQTRWALSYLRGPLSRRHIQMLMRERKQAGDGKGAPKPAKEMMPTAAEEKSGAAARPAIPSRVRELFLPPQRPLPSGRRLVYRPALLGRGRLHFVRATYKVDCWRERSLLKPVDDEFNWEDAGPADEVPPNLNEAPDPDAGFSEVPVEMLRAKSYTEWKNLLKDHFYRTQTLTLFKCAELKRYSQPGESEAEFRIALRRRAAEERDLKIEKLRKRYTTKLASLKSKIQSAGERLDRESSQAQAASYDSVVSLGSSLLGAFFGRKLASKTNVRSAAGSMRRVSRAGKERDDVARAREKLQQLHQDLGVLEDEFAAEVEQLEDDYRVDALELEPLAVRPRKTDIQVQSLDIVWRPWFVDQQGQGEAAYVLGE